MTHPRMSPRSVTPRRRALTLVLLACAGLGLFLTFQPHIRTMAEKPPILPCSASSGLDALTPTPRADNALCGSTGARIGTYTL